MFRQGPARTGYAGGAPVLGMNRPTPIWIYPVVEDPRDPIDNEDAPPAFVFVPIGAWTLINPLTALPLELGIDPYGDDYLTTTTDATGSAIATWTYDFPDFPLPNALRSTSGANFFIYVYLPAKGNDEGDRAEDAHYTVTIGNGVTSTVVGPYILDHRDHGWIQLGYGSFTVHNGDSLSIKLTNKTEIMIPDPNDATKEIPKPMNVIADAVMITQDSGTVFSSPVLVDNPAANPDRNVLVSCSNTSVSLTGTDSRYVGWITGIGTERDSGITRVNPATLLSFADDRGIMKWVYPAPDRNWISGGISTTPTIVQNGVAVIPAGDGQIYVIDPSRNYTNDIAVPSWRGPGYMLYNPDSTKPDTAWTVGTHAGFQQDPNNTLEPAYYHVPAVAPSTSPLATATWTQSVTPIESRSYKVEVWIPPSEGVETYIVDARYHVEWEVEGRTTKRDIRLNQQNGGMWLSLGNDYYITTGGTITVTLNNATDMDLVGPPPLSQPIPRWVAADAMRVVPADIGSFEFSSPIVQATGTATYITVGSTGGRVYQLKVGQNEPVWTYPTPDKPPLGAIYASIMEHGGNLYVGSADGHVYSLTGGGTERWVYPSIPDHLDPDTVADTLAQISSTAAYGDYLYVATGGWGSHMPYNSEGRIIAIREEIVSPGPPPIMRPVVEWVYPSLGGTPPPPACGAFVYASPLWMSPTADDPTGVFLGSTDGYFYSVDAAGATPPGWPHINVGGTMRSSPAGARAPFPSLDRTDPLNPIPVDRTAGVGMAFVNSGSTIYGLDLGLTTPDDQRKDWNWGLMGSSMSSPAVYRSRIYTGDQAGYVWAFSTGGLPGAAEAWNTETGMDGPPTTGSEGDDTATHRSRQANPRIDVFTQDDYRAFLAAADISRTSPTHDPITFDLSHPLNPVAKGNTPIVREWGEDTYIIVWDILDPNQGLISGDRRPGDTDFIEDMEPGHKVDITVKSREAGRNADSSHTESRTGKNINYYVDATGYAVWYAAYTYVLDGSSSSNPQTPSSLLNIYTIETPSAPDRKSDTIWIDIDGVPTTNDPQDFTINNPLAIYYSGNYGNAGHTWNVGVTSGLSTSKNYPYVHVNGNDGNWPMVWGGITPHNRPSQERKVIVLDRSLLGMNRKSTPNAQGIYEPARKIIGFRIERQNLRWTGNVTQAVNFIPAWEEEPQDSRLNRPNTSKDYPNIGVRQVSSAMAAGGQDPSQAPQELIPTNDSTLDPLHPPVDTTPWTTVGNPLNVVVNVPEFQPANMPPDDTPSMATEGELDASGYGGELYAYVDSNGNGVFDKPAGLGMAAAQNRSEAYRVLSTKVHVPVDRRVELSPERMDLGDLPHGFGFTDDSPLPFAFLNALQFNTFAVPGGLPDGRVSPPGFAEWFKEFTARHIGNTNLIDVQVARTDLFSDTVQFPFRDPTYPVWDPDGLLAGSGHFIPYPCIVTSVDGLAMPPATATSLAMMGFPDKFPVQPRLGFFAPAPDGIPPAASPPGLPANQRTLHKPRVGSSGTLLTLPDVAPNFRVWNPGQIIYAGGKPSDDAPKPPVIGVALPLGQPAGTYYGKIRLWDMHEDPNRKPELTATVASNPIEIVVKATESRLTDGYVFDTAPHQAPHLPHLDPKSLQGTGDAMPAAFRDAQTGNIHLYWTSSRFGGVTTGSTSPAPTTTDPWYLYSSTLATDTGPDAGAGKPGVWVEPSGVHQWWTPTGVGGIFPDPTTKVLPNPSPYFPPPPLGASGDVIPGTVRFSSPAIAVDEADRRTWLLFAGQAYKNVDPSSSTLPLDKRRTLESRAYYTELQAGAINPAQVFSTSPNLSGDNIAGDWTTPKFGVKGLVLKRTASSQPELWCFWYGGNADRWRIYYNVNPTLSNHTTWTNEAPLPIPKGLSSAAEPSPVAWWHPYRSPDGQTGDTFDVVYSAYSTFHTNSDIYLSRYKADPAVAKDGHWPVTLQLLPQRRGEPIDVDGTSIICDKLTRDVTRGVWYSRDVDWDSRVVGFTEGSSPTNRPIPSFEVYVQLDPADPATIYKLNYGGWTRDATSGAIAFTYDFKAPGFSPAEQDYVTVLNQLFRTVVINPTDGTVKFLRPPVRDPGPPVKDPVVFVKYRPKAYRLTDDPAADASPCAVADYYDNLRYVRGDPDGNPFFVPSSWNQDRPPTDRLWVLWRRPGVGICYKTIRYMVQLNYQLALEPGTYKPAISSIVGLGTTLGYPVEVDWTKNRLYFAAPDATAMAGTIPVPNKVAVSYTDSKGATREDELYIEFVDEEMGASGKTFGNLTSVAVNESQVGAFKDPWDNKLWVFWTSTRSGNPDVYYETISPLFYGKRFGE